jgi:competence protein ComEC
MRIVVVSLIVCSPILLGKNFLPFFVVWNVGQGQWTSFITPGYCVHIDVGGEVYPQAVETWCKAKTNYIEISHWDFDHYRFLKHLERKFPISDNPPPKLETLFTTTKFKDKNSNSKIQVLGNILLTGDTTVRAETLWSHFIQRPIRILLVPHHGSKTSSSPYLLKHLKGLKMAVVSARRAKYNHPHPLIRARYKQNKIPLLLTENWGHIMFAL